MDKELSAMNLKPIGMVRNEFKQPVKKFDWEKVVSHIMVDSNFGEALDGLEGFSHIIVLYWIHRLPEEEPPTRVHPRGNRKLPLTGVFATRSPHRTNPIGVATVRLLQRWDNELMVEGLDAIDGTPVIDIKPYIPGYDSAADARVPPWIAGE